MDTAETGFRSALKQKLIRWGIYAGVVVIAFLIGFVPMWLSSRSTAAERDSALTQLRKSEISNLLSSSIVDARRGEYEKARQEASNFFTRLQLENDKGDDGFLSADQRTQIKSIFAERDTAITMLAQRDPASLDRLTDLYVTLSQATAPVSTPPPANASK